MSSNMQFYGILSKLLSVNNEERAASEKVYEEIPPEQKVPLLLMSLKDGTRLIEERNLSAVLLRRVLSSDFDEVWPKLGEVQSSVKMELLALLQTESQPELRKKVCDVISELTRCLIDETDTNTWPEVLTFLFECVNSGQHPMIESGLQIFGAVPGMFGSGQASHLDTIKGMIKQCISNQENMQVRVSAVKAVAAFLIANDKDQRLLNHFRDLVSPILQIVSETIQAQEDDVLLKCLIDVAEIIPKYLRTHVEVIMELCLKVAANTEFEDNWRQLAVEVLVTLAETAPAMVRKFGKFIPDLVNQVLRLMCDVEEEEDWAVKDETEDEDNESNAAVGESALDRLACGLGGKSILPHILSNVPPLLQSEDWRCRHAALMAVSACGEGCHKQMTGMLANIVDHIIPFLTDSHARVRFASCNALGQLSTDFGPGLQTKHHAKVLPGLLMMLDDSANPRVQAHAGAALVNFTEDCPKEILAPYLDGIVNKLEQVLSTKFKELIESGAKLVLEQIVTTLASVADTAQEIFINYYDRFVPNLTFIIKNANQPQLKLLRGKTIECVSLIGLAVGKEKFKPDCSEIMQILLEAQNTEEMPDDDPQISYMISAWARMAKILEKDFVAYLPLVMGPVLKAASMKPEIALVDPDDSNQLENDPDWQFVTLGDSQNFGIRTSGLEEKATACFMLVCYAKALKEGFAPYAEKTAEIMVPILKFFFHDDCRTAAAQILPLLVDCALTHSQEATAKLWQYILPNLLAAVDIEPEKNVQGEMLSALGECIEKLGKGCLEEGPMQELVAMLSKLLTSHYKRQDERQEQRTDEDYDEEVEESLENEDEEDVFLLAKVSDISHALFLTHREQFLPVFEQLIPHFVKLIEAGRPWPDRQWGICIWDDLLEFAGPQSTKYQQYFLPQLLAGLTDKQAEIRQASAYGLGVMAQFAGAGYEKVITEALPVVSAVIQADDSRSEDNVNATENMIAAVTKICKYNVGAVNVSEVLPVWLTWLPVWEDTEEAVHTYGYLCDVMESNHPAVLGEDLRNVPKCLDIISTCLSMNVVDKPSALHTRLITLVKQLKGSEMFDAWAAPLSDAQKTAIAAALSM